MAPVTFEFIPHATFELLAFDGKPIVVTNNPMEVYVAIKQHAEAHQVIEKTNFPGEPSRTFTYPVMFF